MRAKAIDIHPRDKPSARTRTPMKHRVFTRERRVCTRLVVSLVAAQAWIGAELFGQAEVVAKGAAVVVAGS